MSCIFRAALEHMFFPPSCDLSTAGMHFEFGDGSIMHTRFEFSLVLADEAALHALLLCKGSGGLKPCALCSNVFNRNEQRGILSQSGAKAVSHTHVLTLHGLTELLLTYWHIYSDGLNHRMQP